jgi:cytochrome c2
MIKHALTLLLVVAALAGLAACGDAQEQASILDIAGGDPEQGRSLIHSYGCGTCHTIGGVRGARGKVGPQLEDYAQQQLLAGFLPNTPRHLIAWLIDPVALKPETGMPAQGLTEAEAQHIAAYLYTLGDDKVRVYPPDPPLPLHREDETAIDLPNPSTKPSETDPRTLRIVPSQRTGPNLGI